MATRSKRQAKDNAVQRMKQLADPPAPDKITMPQEKKKDEKVTKTGHRLKRQSDMPAPSVEPQEENTSDSPNVSMFTRVTINGVALQTVVDEWIQEYKAQAPAALLQVFQFVVDCCTGRGNTPRLPSHLMLQGHTQYAAAIEQVTLALDADISHHYPIAQPTLAGKRVRAALCDFLHVLSQRSQYGVLFDEACFGNIIQFLTTLSDSQVRAFRHTATLASMRLMHELVLVAHHVSTQHDLARAQCLVEQKRQISFNDSETRLETLLQRTQLLEARRAMIHKMVIGLFSGVFMHRYRDTVPALRIICVQELGACVLHYPTLMMTEGYLKYLGRMLFDQLAEVRLHCVRALHALYANGISTNTPLDSSFQVFTMRFRARLVQMCLDKDMEVAVCGMRMVTCIWRRNHDLLSEEEVDLESLYELLFCLHRPLAVATGEFITAKLFPPPTTATDARTARGKKRSPNTPKMRDLVQFFVESEMLDYGAYLVDSLWESCDMLRDYECMLDLLLEEPGRGEPVLTREEESHLLALLVCSVRQAVTAECPVGRWGSAAVTSSDTIGVPHTDTSDHTTIIPRRPPPTRTLAGTNAMKNEVYTGVRMPGAKAVTGSAALTQREQRALREEKERVTLFLIPTVPLLLTRFGAFRDSVEEILSLPLFMELSLYSEPRNERHLDLLLKMLQEMVQRHTDPNTLTAIGRVYAALCAKSLSAVVTEKCSAARDTLVDGVVEALNDDCALLLERRHHSAENSVLDTDPGVDHRTLCNLRRIQAFCVHMDLTVWDMLCPLLLKICDLALWNPEETVMEEEFVLSSVAVECSSVAFDCCQHMLMWRMQQCLTQEVTKEHVDNVVQMSRHYFQICTAYLEHPSELLAQDAFMVLPDMLLLFSAQHIHNDVRQKPPPLSEVLRSLVYTPKTKLMTLMESYLKRCVLQPLNLGSVDAASGSGSTVPPQILTHARRVMLTGYCKLLALHLLPIQRGTLLFKQHAIVCEASHFHDLLKSTLTKLRDYNREETMRMLATALQHAFEETPDAHKRTRPNVKPLMELAHQINLMLCLDAKRGSAAFAQLHVAGIRYCGDASPAPQSFILSHADSRRDNLMDTEEESMPPPWNVNFFYILDEFTGKLLKPERDSVLKTLNQFFPNVPDSPTWAGLVTYKSRLENENLPRQIPEAAAAEKVPTPGAAAKRKPSTTKTPVRKLQFHQEDVPSSSAAALPAEEEKKNNTASLGRRRSSRVTGKESNVTAQEKKPQSLAKSSSSKTPVRKLEFQPEASTFTKTPVRYNVDLDATDSSIVTEDSENVPPVVRLRSTRTTMNTKRQDEDAGVKEDLDEEQLQGDEDTSHTTASPQLVSRRRSTRVVSQLQEKIANLNVSHETESKSSDHSQRRQMTRKSSLRSVDTPTRLGSQSVTPIFVSQEQSPLPIKKKKGGN